MESLETIATKVMSAREQRVRELLGDHIAEEARKMADEIAAEYKLPPGSLHEVSFWGATRVREFLDPTHQQAPNFFACRVCWDKGFQVIEERPGKSDSRACPACQKGILALAGDWLPVLRPVGRHGKRYDSDEGREHFQKAFRHLSTLRDKLLQAVEYLERREGGKA